MEKAHGVLLLLIFTLFAGSAVWLKLALSGPRALLVSCYFRSAERAPDYFW